MKSSLLRLFLAGAIGSLLSGCGGGQSLPAATNASPAAVVDDGAPLQAEHTCHWYTHHDLPEPASCGGSATPSPAPSATPTAAATATPTAAATATPLPTPTPVATPTSVGTSGPPPSGFIFSQYKDVGINLNWNTNVISTEVTGTLEPLISVMPAGNNVVSLAFATGTCGSETWATIPAATFIAANMPAFAASSKYYIVSTGGAAGSFTCPTTAAFVSFVKSYYTTHMIGVDFDIEAGQSQAVITQLVTDVKAAQAVYPNLRFSFTVGTEGGLPSYGNALGSPYGVDVMSAIKSVGLTNYTINLMTMDYGSAVPSNCIVVSGACEMGQSAVEAAEDLHSQFGVPYDQIELTPMIGGNDTRGETFTIADVATVSSFVKQNGLAGVHFWSFDRDVDCAPGAASPTCNSYGSAGTLGFTNAFLSDLGL